MTSGIVLKNVHYAYARSEVLKGLSFSIDPGDFFIIIGPNGSGKTTLMRLICGLEKPSAGQASISGRLIQSINRKKLAREIAFVPQSTPLEFPFTVFDVVLMGRTPYQGILGMENPTDVAKAKQAIEFTGITKLATRKISQLSGGERQLAFIARAICQEPTILLLDEPTASLDLSHQIHIMDLMEKLRTERSTTIVMVSHDVNLAAMYATRLLLLNKGEIAHIGSTEAVLTYQNLEASYGCPLLVDENPMGAVPRVTLVPGKYITKK